MVVSRIQPADTPPAVLFPTAMAGKITSVRPKAAAGEQLADKLQARGGGGSGGADAADFQDSLTDFESDLAHALALSEEEAGSGGPAPVGGMAGGGAGPGHRLGGRESGAAAVPRAAAAVGSVGEDYALQAALCGFRRAFHQSFSA